MSFFSFMADPIKSIFGQGPVVNSLTAPIVRSPVVQTLAPVVGGALGTYFLGPGWGTGVGAAAGSAAAGGAKQAAGGGGNDVNTLKNAAIAGGIGTATGYLGANVSDWLSGLGTEGGAGAQGIEPATTLGAEDVSGIGTAPASTPTAIQTPIQTPEDYYGSPKPASAVSMEAEALVPSGYLGPGTTVTPTGAFGPMESFGNAPISSPMSTPITPSMQGGSAMPDLNNYLYTDYPSGMEPSGMDTGLGYQPNAVTNPGVMDYLNRGYNWAGNNPGKLGMMGLIGLNLANSFNQAGMNKGINQAQTQSYQDYLGTINPPEATKQARYQTLLGNVRNTAGRTYADVASRLAARGIRGRGVAGPTGDVAEAERQAENAAYNQIFGTYNVPSGPGPAAYSPSGGQLATSQATQVANYLYPLLMMSQMYGGRTA